MTRSRNVRLYRACQRCRQRKLKCDPTTSPDGARSSCRQCVRASNECVLAGSRRGGDFSRFRRPRHGGSSTPVGSVDTTHEPTAQTEYREKAVENPIYDELTNPGDALQILARLAAAPAFADRVSAARREYSEAALSANSMMAQSTVSAMELLVISVLGTDLVDRLLHRYEAPPEQYWMASDCLATQSTTTPSVLLSPKVSSARQICESWPLMSRSSWW
ncbi:hypothetical protein ASPVEDRAFT_260308 [Aspergillus versicolor CBS 583.65]|uniref:Zn(2)-C6 fungal-type domain-containing protein n=1 Tax=Aspergillus versicolor CBS 583.65 TaxID=1036611 RepID=A0A1L9P5U6_ASPVE|nr:uncharacterized protein ASPVEDRAFT_260308 [Aspergillus versicolor CBS 583.65]OJI96895.1 hypothetical protein ASPVEDRAFT_260308 [Aspergillus versicolor CBS 583.65]